MLKSFNVQGEPIYNFIAILQQAIRVSSFNTVRDTFLSMLTPENGFSDMQVLAINLAGSKFNNPGDYPNGIDDVLMKILNIDWSQVNAGNVTALLPEQRAAILTGIMNVCRQIILQEAARLESITELPTVLPEDWNTPDPPTE